MDFGLEKDIGSGGGYQELLNAVLNAGIGAVFQAQWSKTNYVILLKFQILRYEFIGFW